MTDWSDGRRLHPRGQLQHARAMTLPAIASPRARNPQRRPTRDDLSSTTPPTDGSAAAIAAHPLQPGLIALGDNVGFAPANNLAAPRARGNYVLLLNPDTVVLDGAIDRLVAFAARAPGMPGSGAAARCSPTAAQPVLLLAADDGVEPVLPRHGTDRHCFRRTDTVQR